MSDAERTIEHLLAERPWQTFATLKRALPNVRRSTLDGLAEVGRITRHNPGSHEAVQYGPRDVSPPRRDAVPAPMFDGLKRPGRYNTGQTGNVVAWLAANEGWHRATALGALTGYRFAATLASSLANEGRIAACVLHDGRKAFAALGTPFPASPATALATPAPPAAGTDLSTLAAALTAAESAYKIARDACDAARDARDAARDKLIAAARGEE